jgi:DNA gyrase/topoisomerase IV subunit A
MKISKTRLQQIIKEEISAIREEENLANELRDDMEELMRSGLFSKADRKDKMLARRKIYSVLKRTRLYGGENTFYEEMLDDALGGHGSDLQQRLADAAGMDVVDWAEKLSAWATGGGDFDDDYDL